MALTAGQTTQAATTTQENNKSKQAESSQKFVIVKPGDYLVKLAKENNSKAERIFFANTEIKNPDLIYPDQKLRIPYNEEQLTPRDIPVKQTIDSSTASTAAAAPVRSAPKRAAAPAFASGSAWDRLAACESGGNWSINTGNGYYGGLQFDSRTWLGNGGGAYASRADLASREQQIEIASRVQAARGWSPWPACTSKLGLR